MHAMRLIPCCATLLVLLSSTLTGCAPLNRLAYKADVAQGHCLDTTTLQQLKIGLTQEQVTYLLGSPLVQEHLGASNSWIYLSYEQKRHQPPSQKIVRLRFDKQRRVCGIESNFPLPKPEKQAK